MNRFERSKTEGRPASLTPAPSMANIVNSVGLLFEEKRDARRFKTGFPVRIRLFRDRARVQELCSPGGRDSMRAFFSLV